MNLSMSEACPSCHLCSDLFEGIGELAERLSLSRGTSERLRLSKPPMAAICFDTSDLVCEPLPRLLCRHDPGVNTAPSHTDTLR